MNWYVIYKDKQWKIFKDSSCIKTKCFDEDRMKARQFVNKKGKDVVAVFEGRRFAPETFEVL
jgi:hypothetical protein